MNGAIGNESTTCQRPVSDLSATCQYRGGGGSFFNSTLPFSGTQVHRYTGTQVHRYTGTQVHRYTGTQVHRYTGTQVHRYTGTQVHRYTGTQVHRYTGTQVHRYTGTQVHRYTGTQVHRYTGTQVHRYTGTQVHITFYLVHPSLNFSASQLVCECVHRPAVKRQSRNHLQLRGAQGCVTLLISTRCRRSDRALCGFVYPKRSHHPKHFD